MPNEQVTAVWDQFYRAENACWLDVEPSDLSNRFMVAYCETLDIVHIGFKKTDLVYVAVTATAEYFYELVASRGDIGELFDRCKKRGNEIGFFTLDSEQSSDGTFTPVVWDEVEPDDVPPIGTEVERVPACLHLLWQIARQASSRLQADVFVWLHSWFYYATQIQFVQWEYPKNWTSCERVWFHRFGLHGEAYGRRWFSCLRTIQALGAAAGQPLPNHSEAQSVPTISPWCLADSFRNSHVCATS